ncbi:branched-chain amino acid ABC transporter permease [Teichococcus vastitatis]|uniref:Branched-chain amino acid ABC transporter permease n=1 Tax=Teichococcus vastitatis TaxID=2307076 RepID=A0ABS9W8D7_9PROT|nr:branched-chain amino acid ABC transporter permease [Pseudoroseomonas vastitatis]MCI0755288.1 branched-chain amino acid ABC transporter permease [Pseudoroseomonas vastitatis]
MDSPTALMLMQEGLVGGAIYGLLALALVITFTVTRIILVPIGEFAAFGALTLSALEAGSRPATLWLLAALSVGAAALRLWRARRPAGRRALWRDLAVMLLPALLLAGLTELALVFGATQILRALLALLIVVPMGPHLYDLVYRPLVQAGAPALLLASVALHLALMGAGLAMFGAAAQRTTHLAAASLSLGPVTLGGQTVVVALTVLMLGAALLLFFQRSLTGKALRATAVNPQGARLVAISPALCGHVALTLAAAIGALAGILASAGTAIAYDTGFALALKGFLAAVIGGLGSYPLAAIGALGIGLAERFSLALGEAGEALIFAALLPVLLWRSWQANPAAEESEE